MNIIQYVSRPPVVLASRNALQLEGKPPLLRQLEGSFDPEVVNEVNSTTIRTPNQTIRVFKLPPGERPPHIPTPIVTRNSLPAARPAVVAPTIAPLQTTSIQEQDAQLASQLDGLFNRQVLDFLLLSEILITP